VVVSIVAFVWVITTGFAMGCKHHRNILGQAAILTAPLAFFIGWIALWHI
jgi:hypothetical protein